MATEIIVNSREFLNQFNNGVLFDQNTSDVTTNLAGSVMEFIKVAYEFDVSWAEEASISSPWTIENLGSNLLRIRKQSGNFEDTGFSISDLVDFSHVDNQTTNTFEGTVTNITNTWIYIQFTAITLSSAQYASAEIRGKTPLTALQFTFGLIENGETFNVESKVSGNDQGYYSANVGIDSGGGRSTAFQAMDVLGDFQDWVTGSAQVRYVSNPNIYTQRFEVEHIFMIVPFYTEGEINNLKNNVPPALYAGLNSLKYVFEAEFRTVLSNPNTAKITIEEDNEGSVGWFNKNFAGFNNFYNVDSVDYEDSTTGLSSDGLIVGTKTKVTAVISSTKTFSGTDRFGVFVSKLSTVSEYTNKPNTTLIQNFILDSAHSDVGASNVNGSTIISNLTGAIVATNLQLTFFVEYTVPNQLDLDNTTNYLISIQVGDKTLSSGNSDRVVLIGDVNEYDQNADIPGLIAFNTINLFQEDTVAGVDPGTTDGKVWIQDDTAIEFNFELDLNKDAVLNTLDYQLIAFNNSTEEFFVLDSLSFDISGAIISSGVQQLEVSTNRGYLLDTNSQFNEVTITTGTNAGGIQQYNGVIGQKMSWQDYTANLGVDTVFFDSSEINNNLNNKAFNYSNLQGYEIRHSFLANVSGTNTLGQSGLTDYLIMSPNITVNDYDDDHTGSPALSVVITTIDPDTLTDLGGAIQIGNDTIMKATWTDAGGAITSISGVWAWHELQGFQENGYGQEKISTEVVPLSSSILKPLSGETELKISIVGNDIVTECLIDGSQVTAASNLTISARLESTSNIVGVPPVDRGKITEGGDDKITETGDQKVIE